MVVYDVADRKIRLRQTDGTQFEFAVVGGAAHLRLCRPPRWATGGQPADAEVRVYLAEAAAKGIARDLGMLR